MVKSSKPKTFSGGCHCGQVRYEVRSDLNSVISCNCSICSKRGSLLNFVPASEFELKTGGESLIDYQFHKHVIHHLFCSTCGIVSFARGIGADGSEMVAVNVRCLDNIDLASLTITPFDGSSL